LARRFYIDEVAPRIARQWPALRYSAGLIAHGSEVLGFDDEVSQDHHWGPRVMLFFGADDLAARGAKIRDYLAETLPYEYGGFPTNFSSPDPDDSGVQLLAPITDGPVNHRVELLELRSFLAAYIGIRDITELTEHDWLTLPEQKLCSLVCGEVFHDGLAAPGGSRPVGSRPGVPPDSAGAGLLSWLREHLAYYPVNVWYYQMAAGWARIGQEEHLMGRAGSVGDEVGSALIGARIVQTLMRLCFLIERTYAPYAKWFGAAFRKLRCANALYPALRKVLCSPDWNTREKALVPLYEKVAQMHNALGITRPLPDSVHQFHGRPFSVIADQGFTEALLEKIDDDFLTPVTRRSPIGGIDLLSDNTDLLSDPAYRPAIRQLFD
jgi:hypothetical protein